MYYDDKLKQYAISWKNIQFKINTKVIYEPIKINDVDTRLKYKYKNDRIFKEAYNYITSKLAHNTDDNTIRESIYEWFKLILKELFNYYFNNNDVINNYLKFNGIDKEMYNIDELLQDENILNFDTIVSNINKLDVISLLALAFTPALCSTKANSEILEFNGDKIINSIIGSYLVNIIPLNESRLTNMIFRYTDKKFFAEISREMGIDKLITWNMNSISESTSEDAFEAFIKVLDIISHNLNSKLILMKSKINIHFNLVEILTKYIFDKIEIDDVIKPDITFITELFSNCSGKKDKLIENVRYTFKDTKRSTLFWFKCNDETLDKIIKYMAIDEKHKQTLYALFKQQYILKYTEKKIAKAIVCRYIVNSLKDIGLDIVKFTNIKSEVLLRNNIKLFCNKEHIEQTLELIKSIITKLISKNELYLDVIDSKKCTDTILKIKVLPINRNNMKLHINEVIILKYNTKTDVITTILKKINDKIDLVS